MRHQADFTKVLVCRGQKLQELLTKETDEFTHLKGTAAFINTGLHLEAEMYVINHT
jgi:hypothetical protein